MPAVKCPNPSCTFLFDPAQVPPGAVLVCPRCGMRYTLGSQAEAAYPATATVRPGDHPALPADDQPTGEIAGLTATPGPVAASPAPARPPAQRRGGFGSTLLTIVGLVAALAVGIAAVVLVAVYQRRGGPAAIGGDAEVKVEDRNFAYTLPKDGWAKDPETQNAMGVNVFALRRADEPTGWVTLAVTDYVERSPTAAELHAETRRHLDRLFQYVPPGLKPEPATWAGHAATKYFFRGEVRSTGLVCVGEAYELAHKGVGYWFYAWAAEGDAAALSADFDAMRERFRTLGLRDRWTGKAPGRATFVSTKPNSRFRLTSDEKLWAAPDLLPTDEDAAAELLLKAELRGRGKRDFNPTALAVVLVVPGKGDPYKVAEAYLRKRYVRDPELFGPTDIEVLTGEPDGGPPAGRPVTRWHVSPGGAGASKVAQKLVAFAAMPAGDEVVVAEASCPWSEREVWERRLVDFVTTLSP